MNKSRSTPLVSVIVPVFNSEKHLTRCLDSLREQSLEDIEIVLVDDGSTDASPALCDSYAEQDARFTVTHQANAGVSAARNKGLSLARGEYVMFVDSDDFVENDFCRYPYEQAEQNVADIVVFRFDILRDGDVVVIGGPAKQYSGLKTSDEALRLFEYADVYVWNKLYRRCLFSGISFPQVSRYEEHGVTHRLIHAAERVRFTDEVLYHYDDHGDSLSSQFDVASEIDRFRLASLQWKDFSDWGLVELVQERQMRAAIRYLVKVGRKGPYARESAKLFAQKTGPLSYYSKKENLLHKLFCISPALFDLTCMLGNKRLKE